MKNLLYCLSICLCLTAPSVFGQTINPDQIRPSTNNTWVITTVGGHTVWAPAPSGSGCNVSGSAGYMLLDDGSGNCVDANSANIGVHAVDNTSQGIELDEQGSGGFEVNTTFNGSGLGQTFEDFGSGGITLFEFGSGGIDIHAGSGGLELSGGGSSLQVGEGSGGGGLAIVSGGTSGPSDDLYLSAQTNHIELHSGTISNSGYVTLDTSDIMSGDTFNYTLPRDSGTLCLSSGTGCQIEVLKATTASIGGSPLLAGNCTAGSVTIAGAVVGSPVIVSASDGSLPEPTSVLSASVTTTDGVQVQVCVTANATPTAKTYNVSVIE